MTLLSCFILSVRGKGLNSTPNDIKFLSADLTRGGQY